MSKRRLVLFACGGTIAMTPDGTGGVTPAVTGEELVSAVPQLAVLADLEVVQFRQKPSCHLGLADCIQLAAAVDEAISKGAAGVVVTQGTDTIEETAFALDLLLCGRVPVVVTGAMRNPKQPGADGPANLLAAAQAALFSVSKGLGVLVCMNERLHAARHVIKADTQNPDAFTSGDHGLVGRVLEGRVSLVNPVSWSSPLSDCEGGAVLHKAGKGSVARVPLVKIAMGDDGSLVVAAQEMGCDGMVVEAMGAGHVPPAVADALEAIAKSKPVLLCSRTRGGEIFTATYGFAGSEMDLLKRGLLPAGWLDGLKARVFLSVSLTAGVSRERIEKALRSFGGPEPEVI
jgi:L-asparaginase